MVHTVKRSGIADIEKICKDLLNNTFNVKVEPDNIFNWFTIYWWIE